VSIDLNLSLLLGAFPTISLTKFAADDYLDMKSRTLGLLLKRHSHLQELSACIRDGESKAMGPVGCRYLVGNFDYVTSLTIVMVDDQKGHESWFPRLASLTTLILRGRSTSSSFGSAVTMAKFHPWLSQQRLPKVRSVYLEKLTFEPESGRLDQWLELSCLETLTVRGCKNMATLFRDLAVSFAQHQSSSLTEVSILVDANEDWVSTLEPVLKLAPGMERLYVSTSSSASLHLASVACQGKSLLSFVMDPQNQSGRNIHDAEDFYSVRDIERLIEGCPNLEEVGLSLMPRSVSGMSRNHLLGLRSVPKTRKRRN